MAGFRSLRSTTTEVARQTNDFEALPISAAYALSAGALPPQLSDLASWRSSAVNASVSVCLTRLIGARR